MPVRDVSDFTYVDLGCGKDRSLFAAAELPFKRIIGVELSKLLYRQCCANLRSFRLRNKQSCRQVEGVQANAKDSVFP